MVAAVRIRNKRILAEAHKRTTPDARSDRLVDLSHDVEDGMVTYRGLPAPVIRDYWTRENSRSHLAPGTEFHIGRIEMVASTGTYVDSPCHRYAGGTDLAGLPLAAAGAEWLAGQEAALVGIDSLNIGDTADVRRPAHSVLLGRDIPVVEHPCGLDRLPDTGFRFFAVPVKVRGFGTFPVRAFAVV